MNHTQSSDIIPTSSPIRVLSNFFWLGLLLIAFGILSGSVRFWEVDGPVIFSAGSTLALLGGVATLFAGIGLLYYKTTPKASPMGAGGALLLLFLSDWLCRRYSLFQGPSIRGEILLCGGLFLLMLRARALSLLAFLLPLLFFYIGYNFIDHSAGRTLVSDDNASFIFRLISLKDAFPSIPFYSPVWNGGYDARDFFATGSLNLFLIMAPFLYCFDIYQIYNYVALVPLFILLPLSTYLACRILAFPKLASSLAPLLAISSSLVLYRWALKYGTMGFITSACLLPLVVALSARFLNSPETLSKRSRILFVITASLALLWTPVALSLLPLSFLALPRLRSIFASRPARNVLLALTVINLPWLLLFVTVSKVLHFVHAEKPSYSEMASQADAKETAPSFKLPQHPLTPATVLKTFREAATTTNPLILIFTIPGIFLFARHLRTLFLSLSLWLLFLGGIVVTLKPQLELDRMLLILAILSAIPTARALSELFEHFQECTTWVSRVSHNGIALLSGGFLLAGPLVVCGIVNDRSLEQFSFASPLSSSLTLAIKTFGGDGRTLFSGFVLHDLDNAHIAHLPYLTGKPLMASSPFHNLWRYRQIFPESFVARMNSGGIEEYLNLYNVTAVISHEKMWREYFQARPQEYTQVWQEDKFTLFTRKNYHSSYLLKGDVDSITATTKTIVVTPSSSELVLKYNYLPFLKSSSCELSGEVIAPDVTFIKLSGCTPHIPVTIESVSPILRFFKEVGGA